MAYIEDRPLTEFELDCIVVGQQRLRKEPLYMQLLEKRKEMTAIIKSGGSLAVPAELLGQLEYQIGFWEGKMFADMLAENPDGVKIRDICLDLNKEFTDKQKG